MVFILSFSGPIHESSPRPEAHVREMRPHGPFAPVFSPISQKASRNQELRAHPQDPAVDAPSKVSFF
jgi:hypothetical protein